MKGGRVPITRSPLVLQSVNDINMGLSLLLYECQLVYPAAMERLGGFKEGGGLKKKTISLRYPLPSLISM